MGIQAFLARHDASGSHQTDRSAADEVLAEIAEQAVRSADAEKFLRTVEFALRHERSCVRIRLDEGCDESNRAVIAARRLANVGVLTHVNVARGQSALVARVASRCSDEVRQRVMRLVQHGQWLEIGAAELVRSAGRSAGVQAEVAVQLHVTFGDGSARELDIVAAVGEGALLIECKAGPGGPGQIGRFAEVAVALGVPANRALLLAPRLDAAAARDLMAFHPVSVVDRKSLQDVVGDALADLAREEADRFENGAATVTPQTPEVAPKHRASRAEIECAIADEVRTNPSPMSISQLVPLVRDRLGCARRPVNDVARILLANESFLDPEGEAVRDFGTPIASVVFSVTDPPPRAVEVIELHARENGNEHGTGFLRRLMGRNRARYGATPSPTGADVSR